MTKRREIVTLSVTWWPDADKWIAKDPQHPNLEGCGGTPEGAIRELRELLIDYLDCDKPAWTWRVPFEDMHL